MTASVVVLYHSGFGHTAAQAQAVLKGAAGVAGVRAQLVPVEQFEQHWAALDAANRGDR